MKHRYRVGELFIYNGNYDYLHGEIGEVREIKGQGAYRCALLTEKEVPFKRFRLHASKMIPYKREPDWEV